MTEQDSKARLLGDGGCRHLRFCLALENARESEKSEFVAEMLGCLPRLYILFSETEEETPENDNLVHGLLCG